MKWPGHREIKEIEGDKGYRGYKVVSYGLKSYALKSYALRVKKLCVTG